MTRLSLLALSAFALACGPAPSTEGPKPTSLALASSGAVSVELLSFSPLAVGQSRVLYKVTQDGQPVTKATLAQKPVMHMTSMTHGCPLQNPAGEANADGYFEGLIVFSMASMGDEYWNLALDVTVDGAASPVTVDFGKVTVADSTMKKVVTRGDKKIILSYGYPAAPKVGANEVVITAHMATDMMKMNFATVDDLTFTLTPEMPSMGHGSNGNVNPTRGDDGLYRGTVVFSMPGDWVVHLGVLAADAQLATYDFALDL
jgi:hypothetical protein